MEISKIELFLTEWSRSYIVFSLGLDRSTSQIRRFDDDSITSNNMAIGAMITVVSRAFLVVLPLLRRPLA